MKKIIGLVAIIAVMILNGCGGKSPNVVTEGGIDYEVKTFSNGDIEVYIKDDYKINLKDTKSYEKILKLTLKKAAEVTRKKGYSKFIVINAGINNLNGSPLNNYKNLKKYITLNVRKNTFETDGRNQARGKPKKIHTPN